MMKKLLLLIIAVALPITLFFLDHELIPRKPASDSHGGPIEGTDQALLEATAEDFKKAFKYKVLKNVRLQENEHGFSLQLSLFFLKNSEGAKVFVCDEYPIIDLIFSADGVAFSGEVPQMVVRGPCLADLDQTHLEPFPIPLYPIIKSPLNQKAFVFELRDSRDKVDIFFRNIVEFWPSEWTWVGVKYYGKDPAKSLTIDGYEILSVLGKPLILRVSPNE